MWDNRDLLAARVDGDAAATGRRPVSESTPGPCPGWARAPASGGWDLRRMLGSSALLYDRILLHLQHPGPHRPPSPATPDAATTQGVDLRVGSAEVASKSSVTRRIEPRVGSPAREASVIGSPADIGLLP